MKKIMKQLISIIKDHPIKIIVSGTGISLIFGVSKIVCLKYTDIIQILSQIKCVLINNIVVLMICICVIVIASYIFVFKIRELKVNESTNLEILKGFKNIAGENVNGIEIHKNDEELSISINNKSKKYNSKTSNNMYALKRKKEIDTSKEIISN